MQNAKAEEVAERLLLQQEAQDERDERLMERELQARRALKDADRKMHVCARAVGAVVAVVLYW